MLDKALGFRPDVYVPDMEDSVPVSEKVNARDVVRRYLPKLNTTGRGVIPRVNALDTGLTEDDLTAVMGPHIHGVSIGKIQTRDDIRSICEIMQGLENNTGLKVGDIKLIPWIETASAVVHCHEICTASPRIVGVAFGAEDFTNDMGIERTEDETALNFARSTVCVAARAAHVTALDTPYFEFKDQDGLARNALSAKRLGFKGKFAIHPAQVDPLNEAFSPSQAEIDHARRVVAAFSEAERAGRGSTSLDGIVVDVPVVKRAQATLQLAESLQGSE